MIKILWLWVIIHLASSQDIVSADEGDCVWVDELENGIIDKCYIEKWIRRVKECLKLDPLSFHDGSLLFGFHTDWQYMDHDIEQACQAMLAYHQAWEECRATVYPVQGYGYDECRDKEQLAWFGMRHVVVELNEMLRMLHVWKRGEASCHDGVCFE